MGKNATAFFSISCIAIFLKNNKKQYFYCISLMCRKLVSHWENTYMPYNPQLQHRYRQYCKRFADRNNRYKPRDMTSHHPRGCPFWYVNCQIRWMHMHALPAWRLLLLLAAQVFGLFSFYTLQWHWLCFVVVQPSCLVYNVIFCRLFTLFCRRLNDFLFCFCLSISK